MVGNRQKRQRRKANRARVMEALDAAGIEYVDLNNGSHLRIDGGWDVFPSRDGWKGPEGKGVGVHNLIQKLNNR